MDPPHVESISSTIRWVRRFGRSFRGYRLTAGGYEPLRPDDSGRRRSIELGLWLRVEDGDLVLYDVDTGERLLTEAEAERAAREAAEAEVGRLREELRRRGHDN